MGLFDAFTGKAQARDIEQGRAQADEAVKRGVSEFVGTREDYLGRSLGEFDAVQPDIQIGRDANALYRRALGLDGREAQTQFFNEFESDPGYQALQNNAVNAVEGSAAARGGLFSGNTIRGITDRVSLLKNNLFTDRLNRLAQLGQTGSSLGFSTASARAGLQDSAGGDIANARFGANQLLANNAVNTANALAASRSIPINNLLALGDLAVKAFKPAGPTFALGGK